MAERLTKAQIHETALIQFDTVQEALYQERKQCLEDRRFYSIAGAQWEGNLADQFKNKPKFEVNKVHLAVIRIINEYRNNRISVNFISRDGSDNDDLAEKCNGLYRSDEQDSCAEEAYDNAFEEAVGGGFGAWRLRAEYEDEEDEDSDYQRVRIEPIYDADSCVYFDLDAKRQDKSDATFCFVITSMSPKAYMDEWGDDPDTWNKAVTDTQYDWCTPDAVYVAEYYKVVKVKDTVYVYRGLDGAEEKFKEKDFKDDPMLEDNLLARGFDLIRKKNIKCKRVRKYILSGGKVLEDCGFIAGKHIPIVPVYGKRWFIDNIERCMGHVRLCKDAQRLKNMQLSKLGEISALSSTQKPVLLAEQIIGHEQMWAEDNLKDYPYLLINKVLDASGQPVAMGATSYTQPPQVPPAMAALMQVTDVDLKEILGNQEAGEEIQSNISGKAIELIQTRLDMQSFIYISNMSKAIKRSGEIWLGMATDIYVEEKRVLKTVGEQGEISNTELSKPTMTDQGEIEYESDLSKAKFDVAVDVGPTSASRKAATVRALTGMMQIVQDPQTAMVLTSMAMMNMEGEGLSDTRAYFRDQLVKMGAIKPTEEEQQELMAQQQNQQPDPQALYLQAEAEKSQALAVKAQADTTLTMAKSKEIIAKTAATLANIDREDQKQLFDEAERLGQAVSAQPQQVSEYEGL